MMLTMSGSSGVFAFDRAKLYADLSEKTVPVTMSTYTTTKPTRRSSSGSSSETVASLTPPPPYKPEFVFDLTTMLKQVSKGVEQFRPRPLVKKHRVYGDVVDEHYTRNRFAGTKRRSSRAATIESNSSVGTASSSDEIKHRPYRPAFRFNLSVIVNDIRKGVEQPRTRRPPNAHQRT
ncbi:hypothetical protein ACHHYP_12161 [Achlya hypogyna]|uniref:Uncharacterized protein n=1 Tax=Achlya hypogyna TaxID=1202772 RepID=A0A1V9YHM6_ACHHY|nr:hypothetical protein ACHHYP_12161 [Achlya hypogyna]